MRRPTLICGLLALLACGGDSTGPADRVPATGTYDLRYEGCFGCPPNSTVGGLLMWRRGVEARVQVLGATPDTVRIRYVSAIRYLNDGSAIAFEGFPDTVVNLAWTEIATGGPAYQGRFGYSCTESGCTFLFTQHLRRTGCGFAVLWAGGGGIGDGRCEVVSAP